jgi:glucose/arabinose dehydrogenase
MRISGVALALLVLGGVAIAQTREGRDAYGSWQADKPGTLRLIRPQDLPAPGPSSANVSRVVARPAGVTPQVPAGFKIEVFAEGLSGPRIIRTAPNGDIFVAETRAGRVRVLRTPYGATKPNANEIFASGLHGPFGIAFFPNGDNPKWVYVANTDSVVRFPYRSGDLKATGPAETIVPKLPAGGSHSTRDIVFTPDNARMLVSVGSSSNIGDGMGKPPGGLEAWASQQPLGAAWGYEADRAAILSFDPDGKNQRIFATGIRNCVGLAIQPGTNTPWCSTNERDGLGDDLVPDYVTRVKEGAFYGWPWFYIGNHEDPRYGNARPDLRDKITVPDVLSGVQLPRRISRRCVRGRARLVEQVEADRLQGGPYPPEGRRADRRIRGFRHRLRRQRQRCLGPAGRRRRCQRRCASDLRRRQRHDLARNSLKSTARSCCRARRPTRACSRCSRSAPPPDARRHG